MLPAEASIWQEIMGLHAAAISLLIDILSLLPARNFPDADLREFLRKPLFFLLKSRRRARILLKSPVSPRIFPVYREFWAETS